MPSALRANLFTAIQLRVQTLGHQMSAGEIFAIVDDVEVQIAADASAQADAISDTASFLAPPDVLGG